MGKIANAAASVLEWFNKLPEPVKDTTTYLIAFTGAALLIGPRVADGVSALKSLKDWLSATGTAADTASGQVGTFAGKVGKRWRLLVALGAAELAVQGFSHQVSETGISERWSTALGNVLVRCGPDAVAWSILSGGCVNSSAFRWTSCRR
ncbi:MAG: hypothetical protein IPH03_11830, partial [Tetrasphaera sp.]|nr:hypothetical protein [Tetrasphaera sp.]